MALDSKSTEQLLEKINKDDTISKKNKDLATGVLKVIRELREERERLDSQCYGKISQDRELLKLQKRDFLDKMCCRVEKSIESYEIPSKQEIQAYQNSVIDEMQQKEKDLNAENILRRKKVPFFKSPIENLLTKLIDAAPEQNVRLHDSAPQNQK